jgi:hypothetical protein
MMTFKKYLKDPLLLLMSGRWLIWKNMMW